jgi:hypothetical protein
LKKKGAFAYNGKLNVFEKERMIALVIGDDRLEFTRQRFKQSAFALFGGDQNESMASLGVLESVPAYSLRLARLRGHWG